MEILKITFVINKRRLYRTPTKQELEILNLIAISHWAEGDIEQAMKIFGMLEKCCTRGKMHYKFMFRRLNLVFGNCAKAYEDTGQVEKALEICEKGLKLCVSAGKGDALDFYLIEKASIAEKYIKSETDRQKAMKRYLLHAFYLSDLFKNYTNRDACESYYKEKIEQDIEWY